MENQTDLADDQITTIQRTLGILGLPPADPFCLGELHGAMGRFASNRTLWFNQHEIPEFRCLLQSHLCFTLMAPAGRADRARMGVNALRDANLGGRLSWATSHVHKLIAPYCRFPNQKAGRVTRALNGWDVVFGTGDQVRPWLVEWDAQQTRTWLMKQVKGFGPKAASHFMRNTGLMSGYQALPIIDVHIHKALEGLGMPHGTMPEAEASFTALSRGIKVEPMLLDAVLWSAYSKNWNNETADFDNFGVKN